MKSICFLLALLLLLTGCSKAEEIPQTTQPATQAIEQVNTDSASDSQRVVLNIFAVNDLLSKFLETPHSSYFIKLTDYGAHIRNGIDPDGIYYVVTDTYSAYYAPNNMTVVDTYSDSIFARDLVADYISEGGMQG